MHSCGLLFPLVHGLVYRIDILGGLVPAGNLEDKVHDIYGDSFLNPKPQTPNPKPQTLTPNPKPGARRLWGLV
jgi:hypothetical protein